MTESYDQLRDQATGEGAEREHRERVHQVLEVLHAGAAGMAWSTRYDVEDGLTWDAGRGVWVASVGFAFDGERLHDYSRNGTAA